MYRRYFYIQLNKPTLYHADVRQVELLHKCCLLECYEPFCEEVEERYNLRYIGKGWREDRHIVDKLEKYR